MKQIKDNIHLHLLDDITMKQLAASLHIDYYYFCKLFKHQTGLSPNQYRIRKRIEKSIPLLLDTEKHIAEIASLCGFSNASYFSKQFQDLTGMQPAAFRSCYKNFPLQDFYDLEAILLSIKLEQHSYLCAETFRHSIVPVETVPVLDFNENFHDVSIPTMMVHGGVLYLTWYSYSFRNHNGYNSILIKHSVDGGKTWSQTSVLAEDVSGELHYGSPAFFTTKDRLCLILSLSHTASKQEKLQIHQLDPVTQEFRLFSSLPLLFNATANAVTLPDGRLLIPGRTQNTYPFNNIPSVLISDSDQPDSSWHLVPVTDSPILPDGSQLVYTQVSVILNDSTLYLFCRNDQRKVPLVFVSHDLGESWQGPYSHDIPSVRSKFYSGTLSDGRHYWIGNTNPCADGYDHSRMSIFFSKPGSVRFDREVVLFGDPAVPSVPADICYEPCAVEYDGKLHVVACAADHETGTRGIFDFILPLNQI